jgi:single-strand DNA-binding protein
MGVNRVTLLGNLGKDPELRSSAEKRPVCVLRVATDEWHKDEKGQRAAHTEWHDVVTFGRTAEVCASQLRKGREVFVEGRLRTRGWQGKDGQDRYGTEIYATAVEFVGPDGRSCHEVEGPPTTVAQEAVL